jgi:hypothetical protein
MRCTGTSIHSDYTLMLSSGDTHDILLRCVQLLSDARRSPLHSRDL